MIQKIKNIFRKSNSGLKFKGVYTFTLTDIVTGEKTVQVVENIVPTVARTLIARHLTDPAYAASNDLTVNYAALGSGTSTPANSDVQLQAEVYRNPIASRTYAGNIAFLTAFFSATEAVGTHKEAGLFIAGSGTANSGTLLSRVAVDITKSNTQSLTIDWTLQLI